MTNQEIPTLTEEARQELYDRCHCVRCGELCALDAGLCISCQHETGTYYHPSS